MTVLFGLVCNRKKPQARVEEREERLMEEKRRKLWGLMALVVGGLVLIAIASLGASAWATPYQTSLGETVPTPPMKEADKDLVLPGDHAQYTVVLDVPEESDPWPNVVMTDTIPAGLKLWGLTTTHGSAQMSGRSVTVTIDELDKDEAATINIYVSYEGGAEPGQKLINFAYGYADGFTETLASEPVTLTVAFPLYLPLIMKSYSTP
jgi:uncharacterized repeat protein (TIGR01451 family)